MKIPCKVVEKIILDIPGSKKETSFSTSIDTVFIVNHVVIVIPNQGVDYEHLVDILEYQLGMGFWMIDYILGQNGIVP